VIGGMLYPIQRGMTAMTIGALLTTCWMSLMCLTWHWMLHAQGYASDDHAYRSWEYDYYALHL
jgi:hypothetical protein